MIPSQHATPIVLPPKKNGPRLPPHLAPRFSDTSPETEAVLIDMLRQLTPTQRVQRCFSLSAMAANLSRQAIQRANPELSSQEIGLHWVEMHYGKELADGVREHLLHRG
jgi:hypothetical protein